LEAFEVSANFDENPDKIKIASAVYLGGEMTQNAKSIVIKLMNIVMDNELPNNFDELSKLILKDNNDKKTYTNLIATLVKFKLRKKIRIVQNEFIEFAKKG
jgi:hypothetical protein